tara:strand:+ start:385 stop:771 length:387 start_codon:yes stop_codon:yes gene_type:complete
MKPIELGKLGSVQVSQPGSFAVVSDLCAEWNENASRAKLARLCAAAIGVCWSTSNEGKKPPRYDFTAADPIGYGGAVLDWLFAFGVPMSSVYEAGGALISELFKMIPTEQEVEQAENFTEPEADQSIE